MKKLVFAFAAIVAVSFASCTGTTKNTEVVETVDSVVDSLAAAADSVVEEVAQ